MRLVTTAVVALLLITAPVILESCCLSDCGCGDSDGPARFDFVDMTMTLYSRTTFAPLPSGATTLSEVYFKSDIEARYTSMIETSSVGSAAYACSPAPIYSNQQITSIVITSDSDLSTTTATIFAGEDLGVLFKVDGNEFYGEVADILNKPFSGNHLYFLSDAQLDHGIQTHVFTFRITLDNGMVFEMVTTELSFTAG
jgi:hypothetical protein